MTSQEQFITEEELLKSPNLMLGILKTVVMFYLSEDLEQELMIPDANRTRFNKPRLIIRQPNNQLVYGLSFEEKLMPHVNFAPDGPNGELRLDPAWIEDAMQGPPMRVHSWTIEDLPDNSHWRSAGKLTQWVCSGCGHTSLLADPNESGAACWPHFNSKPPQEVQSETSPNS